MTRGVDDIARGIFPARAPRAIAEGERIHVIGAAGAGASAAALLAQAAGGRPDGCDPGTPSPYTAALAARSIAIAPMHDPAHVLVEEPLPARIAVTKALTSVDPDHPELRAARDVGMPIEAWQQVVADASVNQGGRMVAVAGTHGKSTSAGWLVHMLVRAGRDPAAFVGALLPSDITGGPPATARWGRGDAFIVEADEYAGNFDPYRPSLAVVLNAEWDHPDVFADHDAVVDVFEAWLRGPDAERREVVINTVDRGGRGLAARLHDWGERVTTVAPGAAALESTISYTLEGAWLTLSLPHAEAPIRTQLRLAGAHNVANAACVAAVAARLGLAGDEISAGLATFAGVGRRFDVKGEAAGVLVIDDYGHHPTAIRATVAAARERYPERRVWVAHEPLTYHRAAAMLDDLADALAEADEAVVADIWEGRDPDTSITSAGAVAAAVAARSGRRVEAPGSPEATAEYLAEHVRRGDIVLAMGGGRSYVIADRLLLLLANHHAE